MPSLTESIVEDAALILPAAALTQPLPQGEEWELGYAVGHGLHLAPQTVLRENALFQKRRQTEAPAKPTRHPPPLIEADLVDTALRGSAFLQSEAKPQVLNEAKSNMVALPGQLFYRFENEHAAVAA